jgi:hypothetical protein
MKKFTNTKGGSVLEIIIAVGIFTIVASNVVVLYIGSLNGSMRDSQRLQADLFLQQGFEATRSIRDYNFSGLTNGTYGLSKTNGYWEFSGVSDTVGKFTRAIVVADVERDTSCAIVPSGGAIDPSSKKITETVTWTKPDNQTGTISASQYLTKWENPTFCGLESESLTVTTTAANLANTNQWLEGLTVTNNGLDDVTIDKITITWTNSNVLKELQLDNVIVWDDVSVGTPNGSQHSGALLNITNTVVSTGATLNINTMKFDAAMNGALFTITFTMSDGSTTSATSIQM